MALLRYGRGNKKGRRQRERKGRQQVGRAKKQEARRNKRNRKENNRAEESIVVCPSIPVHVHVHGFGNISN